MAQSIMSHAYATVYFRERSPGLQIDALPTTSHPSLAEVDAYIAARKNAIRFPAGLEQLFQRHRRSYRALAMRAGVLPSIIAYNAFLPAECYLLPNTAWLTIALHILATGWILVAGLILQRKPLRLIRELVGVSMPAVMAAQVLTIFALTHDAAARDYHYPVIVIVFFLNVNVKPDFLFALGGSLMVGLSYAALLLVMDVPISGRLVGVTFMAVAIYLSLSANLRMERDARHAFLRRLQEQLRRSEAEAEAERDPLTGLFNRRHLDVCIARLWSAVDDVTSTAVLLLDVDHFKAFNDHYGHPAGDLCLKRVAAIITSELRDDADAVAARFGGEEFLVLLPRTDLLSAVATGERIRRAIKDLAIPHEAVGMGRVTVSLGAMAGPASSYPAAELVAGADTALYAAKRNGRDQVWPPFVTRTTSMTPPPSVHRDGRGVQA